MNILTAAVIIYATSQMVGQLPPNPSPGFQQPSPTITQWIVTSPVDGSRRYAWGYKDAAGGFHETGAPLGAIGSDGAAQYGSTGDFSKPMHGADVRTSSPSAEATARDIFGRPCTPDGCPNGIFDPTRPLREEIREIAIYGGGFLLFVVALFTLTRKPRGSP